MRRAVMNAAAGDGGARDRRALELDGPNHSANRRALQASPSAACVNELLVRLSDRLHLGRLHGWALDFGRSIIAQARRGGPRWKPSPKQLAAIEHIIAEPDNTPEESLTEAVPPNDWHL